MQSWYEDYDGLIRRICPNYEIALDTLVQEAKGREVIELGCGTGNLTEKLFRNGSRVVAYDTDGSLLSVGREKLSGNTEVTFILGNASEVEYSAERIVMSSLMFHLLDKKERFRIFEKIADAHSDLYLFDRIRGETELEESQFKDSFKDHIRDLTGDIYSELVSENHSNFPDTLNEQREYFESKGYKCRVLFQKPSQGFVAYCFLRE